MLKQNIFRYKGSYEELSLRNFIRVTILQLGKDGVTILQLGKDGVTIFNWEKMG